MLRVILSVFWLLSAPIALAHTNAVIEKKLTHYLESHQEEELKDLERLVNINSGTSNLSGIREVGESLRHQLEASGFQTHWVEEPESMHRAGSLLAERRGSQGKRLLLIGHLDTVFPPRSSFQHFKRQGALATGPGLIDDKGGDLVLLYALKALQAAGALEGTSITVVLTGDEEDSGKPTAISRKALIEAAKHCDLALDFEPAMARDTATIARRGISNWRLEVSGKEAHSSEIFQAKAGDGAIFELARILDSMRRQLAGEKYLSFNPGLILGGTIVNEAKASSQGNAFGKGNVIAKTAFAKGDLRYLTPLQEKAAENKIKAIVSQHLPGTKASLQFQQGIPAMPPTANNMNLLKKYSEVSQSLGYGSVKALDPGLRGAGDISHVASLLAGSLAGLGPVGTGAHSERESMDVNSLLIQTERAAVLIYRLTHFKVMND